MKNVQYLAIRGVYNLYTNKSKHTVRRLYPQFTTYNNQRCGGHVKEYDIHRGGRRRLLVLDRDGEVMGSDQTKRTNER